MTNRKKVVILGGGTGSSRVLMSLKDLPFDITSVVTVSDDGRSTGVLRKEFTAPGMGDIRKVLSNLSTLPDEVKDIMEYPKSRGRAQDSFRRAKRQYLGCAFRDAEEGRSGHC